MKKIAIIGTGIAGMGAAYYLKDQYDVTFYEKNNYPGGHTNTLTVKEDGKDVYIDSGFMVYNEFTYPHFTKLLKELEVPTKETSMSFSVQHIPTGLEYRGTDRLFAQRKNLFNIPYIALLLVFDRFRRKAVEVLEDSRYDQYTVGQYTKEKKYRWDFVEKFLIPMSSAVWSVPTEKVLEFPIKTLVRFFNNHGFLGIKTQLQWRTIEGGSRVYRDKILGLFSGKVFLDSPVTKISRFADHVEVVCINGQKASYDKVIVACHADEALSILNNPTSLERSLLAPFTYHKNHATLHTDKSLMPRTREAWASWNYRINKKGPKEYETTTIYYMNELQGVSQEKDYFVSIDDPGLIAKDKILWEIDYAHPVFNVEASQAQANLPQLNQNKQVYFCGSYFRYGFHEDALGSAVNVVDIIKKEEA